jgi:nitrite reductase/ring-hydroxylating ferredoxin subunit
MLVDGAMVEVQADGELLLVARVGGQYYATQARCAHMGGRLAKGKLNGFIVTCPRHDSQYDVRDGHNVAWIPAIHGVAHTLAEAVKSARGLQVFATQIKDGQVWAEIS